MRVQEAMGRVMINLLGCFSLHIPTKPQCLFVIASISKYPDAENNKLPGGFR